MSLDLINVGAEANDGTGDTPRAAFSKVNAAIAAVETLLASGPGGDYSAEIAALETVQGSQGGAIAAAQGAIYSLEIAQAALDAAVTAQGAAIEAIDSFSGAYDDLSGKPSFATVATTGAYDDLSGKPSFATVATTGAYDDLSGKPTIAPPGVMPNNTQIAGVELFYQSTKPTVRGDGSALGVGDRWWKGDDGTDWFWNGSYWLSTTENFEGYFSSNLITAVATIAPASVGPIFVTKLKSDYVGSNPLSFYTVEIQRVANITLFPMSGAIINTQQREQVSNINLFLAAADMDYWRVIVTATGSPPVTRGTTTIFWRWVA